MRKIQELNKKQLVKKFNELVLKGGIVSERTKLDFVREFKNRKINYSVIEDASGDIQFSKRIRINPYNYICLKRTTEDIKFEIVNQILLAETCFKICDIQSHDPGLGADFWPFYYNLCYTKGFMITHSLLLSNDASEITIKGYLEDLLLENPKINISELIRKIEGERKKFKNLPDLRHTVMAHLDENYTHGDFTRGYMLNHIIPPTKEIIKTIKEILFTFWNWSLDDCPNSKIENQSAAALDFLARIEHS